MSKEQFVKAVIQECISDGLNLERVKEFLATEDGMDYLESSYKDNQNVNACAFIISMEY